jgi:4'-phosphopantetheinyl transferase
VRLPRVDELHLWWVDLDGVEADEWSMHTLLSDDEQARAARYVRGLDRRHFVVARGALRRLLGRYLATAPAAVRLAYGHRGKPRLDGGCGGADVRFNLSHSGGLALIGVTRGREVGVDIERVRDDIDMDAFAAHSFSPRELAALRGLTPPARREAFFACWTRKEAYVKARGDGLAIPLSGFDVSLAPDERAALLEVRADPVEASRWSLLAPAAPPGYAAAVAVAVPQQRVRRA